jgi:hypothetical protein
MTIFFSTILGWFSSIAGRYLVDAGLRFVATKALVYTFLVTTFPIVIKNLLCWLVDTLNEIVQSSIEPGSVTSFTHQLTGLAGWLGEQLLLPTCVSVLLSAIAIRFILNFIPFVG